MIQSLELLWALMVWWVHPQLVNRKQILPAGLVKDHSESTQSQTPWSLSPCFYKTPRPRSEELWIVADPHAHHSYFNRIKQRNACVRSFFAYMVQKSHQHKKSLKGLFCYRQCHQLMSTGNYSVNGRSVIFASIFNKRCWWERVVPWAAGLMKPCFLWMCVSGLNFLVKQQCQLKLFP